MSRSWVIYGAYGHAGSVIVDKACSRGMQPLLAGADRARLAAQAEYYGLAWRHGRLDDAAALDELLREASVVLNCAGPFAATAEPLLQACLRTATHYLDISGEPQVFQRLAGSDEEARQAGIMLLPGVGLDIVPSDYLATYLKMRLPTATRLVLGFRGLYRASPGAINTLVNTIRSYRPGSAANGNAGAPAAVRRIKLQTTRIDFGDGREPAIRVPWGDVVSAAYSTGIEDVKVYLALPLAARLYLKTCRLTGRLELSRLLRRNSATDARNSRDSSPVSRNERTVIFGEATNDYGGAVRALFRGPDSYTVLSETATAAVERVLEGRWASGFHTPTRVYGCELVEAVSDIEFEDVDSDDT